MFNREEPGAAVAMAWGDPAVTSGAEGSFALPAGTVAFLLTDVEASTSSWEADADAMAAAMARHAQILDGAVSAHGGVCPPAQGEGDSVVAAFARASDAVLAARDAQRALVAEAWPTARPLRVRMAVHAGEARFVDDGNYAGQAIIRAARLRAIAHGGQVLVSAAARDLTVDQVGDGVDLIDLGEHRLKDLARPEHVYQLTGPGLLGEFPALRSLDAHPHNLPTQLSSFIGRLAEIDTVASLLESNRLVTICGAGGAGKTRLAQRVAAEVVEQYEDGTWWVELAEVVDPSMIAATVAAALGTNPQVGEHAADALAERLSAMRVLLVLDNCEHLIDGVARMVDRLLRRAPGVAILATSREALEVAGEVAWRIPPLAVPAAETTPMPIGALSQFESVRLFLDRARHVRPNFHLGDDNAPAVAGICQRLDGIPLAIELAAARCRSLSPSQILDGLADAFRLLTGGGRAVLARQQTLEASIGWSHALLSTQEQVLLRRLSVFRGGCTLDDAEAVVADDQLARGEVLDLLDRLVAQSLVQVTDDNLSAPRYTMLETVRQYGARQLEAADETERFRTCHADHFVAVANEVGPRMEGTDERQAFARLVADHDNIRAAFDELASSARWDDYAVLVWSCYWLWQVLNPVEGVSRLTRLFEMGTISRRSDEGRARLAGGYLEYYSGNVVAAFTNVSEALSIGEEIGDETVAGRAAAWLAFMAGFVDPIVALPDLEAAAARLHKASDACGEVWARIMMMTLYFLIRHDQREGRRRYADVVQLIERSGGLYARYHLYGVAARGAAIQGDLTLTEAEARKSETAIRALATAAGLDGDLFARMNGNIDDARTHVALLSGEPRTVLDRLPQLIAENQADSLMLNVLSLAPFLALDRIACGDALGATDVLDELLQLTRPLGLSGLALPYAADAARALGDEAAANALLDELESDSHFESHLYFVCMGRISRSALTLAAGELGSAEDSAHKALVLAHEQLFRHELIQCLELLATIAAANQAWSETARLHGASLSIRQETGITMRLPLYADPYDAAVKAAESALGTEAFAAARAEGHGLGLDDAVAYAQRARGERGRPSFGWDSLTPTEHQVVDLVIEGLTNPQIAERLLVSPDTVKTHLAHVFAKLGVKRRAELAAVAARRI